MSSKDNSLIDIKTTFWRKIINNIKSFLFGNFSKREKQAEKTNNNHIKKESTDFSEGKPPLNNITVEKIDTLNDIKPYNNSENSTNEPSLKEKLENLLKENEILEITLNDKFEELKEIRIKELKTTLQIYKIEEIYLKSYIAKISK